MRIHQWDLGLYRIHLQVSIRQLWRTHIDNGNATFDFWQAISSLQKNRQGRWLLRQVKGESRTAAEVVLDDALVQEDGIDMMVEELDRCWEVTQDQDKASKIEKDLFETQRDVKTEATFMSCVARRKLNFQQLENALGTPLPAVIKGYATLREATLAESSNDKVVMWTGGSYDYDDIVRALVQLDRPEIRPGTSGQSGKTVPTYFTDSEFVNNCAHTLVVLVLCIFGTCRAFLLAEVFLTRCPFVKVSCAPVLVFLKGP